MDEFTTAVWALFCATVGIGLFVGVCLIADTISRQRLIQSAERQRHDPAWWHTRLEVTPIDRILAEEFSDDELKHDIIGLWWQNEERRIALEHLQAEVAQKERLRARYLRRIRRLTNNGWSMS